jgi:hypothetical protein
MCAQCFHYIYPSVSFLHLLPPPTGFNSPWEGPVLPSGSPILKMNLKLSFLFKISTPGGVSLWHFHVYIYYNLNWLMSSIFLHCWFSLLSFCFNIIDSTCSSSYCLSPITFLSHHAQAGPVWYLKKNPFNVNVNHWKNVSIECEYT